MRRLVILSLAAVACWAQVTPSPSTLSFYMRQGQGYPLTGLTTDTDYWYRITTGHFAAQGQFRTSAAMAGTAMLRVERGVGGTIQHGATAGLGSTGASPLDITTTRGAYSYNAEGTTQTVVVR